MPLSSPFCFLPFASLAPCCYPSLHSPLFLAFPAFAASNAYAALTTTSPIIGHPAANAPGIAEHLGIPPYAHRVDPVVTGAVLMSGNAWNFPVNREEMAAARWHVRERGCGSACGGKIWKRLGFAAAVRSCIPADGGIMSRCLSRTVFREIAEEGEFARVVRLHLLFSKHGWTETEPH